MLKNLDIETKKSEQTDSSVSISRFLPYVLYTILKIITQNWIILLVFYDTLFETLTLKITPFVCILILNDIIKRAVFSIVYSLNIGGMLSTMACNCYYRYIVFLFVVHMQIL